MPVQLQQHHVGVGGGDDKLVFGEEAALFAGGQAAVEDDATVGDDADAGLAGGGDGEVEALWRGGIGVGGRGRGGVGRRAW